MGPQPPAVDAVGRQERLKGPRGFSSPPQTGVGRGTCIRSGAEGAVLSTVREQLYALEDRLGRKIALEQRQSDRVRDTAFSRITARIAHMETFHPKLETQVADLVGRCKGLSDEAKAQMRRIDQMNAKLWDWQHRIEDDVHRQLASVGQVQQQVSANFRLATASNTESMKRINERLHRMESVIDERLRADQDTTFRNFTLLESRVHGLENATASSTGPQVTGEILQAAMDARLEELTAKMDNAKSLLSDIQTRLQCQEEQAPSLHSYLEKNDEHLRASRLQLQDMGGRLRDIQSLVQELRSTTQDHGDRLDVLQSGLELQQQAQAQAQSDVDWLKDQSGAVHRWLGAPPAVPEAEPTEQPEAEAGRAAADAQEGVEELPPPEDWSVRLDELETKVEGLKHEQEAACQDAELVSRAAALLESFEHLEPKIAQQEQVVRELADKVVQLESKVTMLAKLATVAAAEERFFPSESSEEVHEETRAAQRGGA